MPPKKGGKAKQKEDAEFDALLKQLEKTTKAKGKADEKERSQEAKHVTAADRHRAMRERERARENDAAKQLEQRAQQRKLQELIRTMMSNGGMGMNSPFLDAPDTKIETGGVAAKNSQVVAGFAAMQGWRRNMEDAHIMQPNFRKGEGKGEDWHFFAVMDGHGGDGVAKTTKMLLPAVVHRNVEAAGGVSDAALKAAYADIDAALEKKHKADGTCGATCVSVMIGAEKIICASVGDSRAVLARKRGQQDDVVPLAFDHKPENDAERARIEANGGHVENNRVNGALAMSRALGDFTYKAAADKPADQQLVTHIPDVITAARQAGDEFVVIACDGIFDVLSNEELVQEVRKGMARVAGEGKRLTQAQLEQVAAGITQLCLAPPAETGPSRAEGTDNMSIIIVQL